MLLEFLEPLGMELMPLVDYLVIFHDLEDLEEADSGTDVFEDLQRRRFPSFVMQLNDGELGFNRHEEGLDCESCVIIFDWR